MTKRLRTYTVHAKPETPEDVVLMRDGFAIGGLVFGGLWLLANRVWLVGTLIVVLHVGIEYLIRQGNMHEMSLMLAQFILALFVATDGRDLAREALERRGYQLVGVVSAEAEDRAILRHFEQTQAA